jgi:very-short-patch-repair endonuclease
MKLFHIEKNELTSFFLREHNTLDIDSLALYSRKNVTWTCNEDHNFDRPVRDFVRSQSCPHCVKKISSDKFLNSEFCKIKNEINSKSIALGDNRTSVFWNCSVCSHSWNASAWSRSKKQSGCPSCKNGLQHSKNEIRIYTELKSLFHKVEQNFSIDNLKYDIFISDLNVLIEYDGAKWHSQEKTILNDIKKNKLAKDNGYMLIRVREQGLEKMSDLDLLLDINTNNNRDDKAQKHIVNSLLTHLNKLYEKDFSNYIHSENFLNDKAYCDFINKNHLENNITLHPKYKEFAKDLNKLQPFSISTYTKINVWWRCDKNHTWEASPLNRKVTGCPHCRKLKSQN